MKSPEAYKTISEVTEEVGVPQHVLRFWEAKFPIRPLKRGGNRRYYKPDDVRLVRVINHLLYVEGLTIRGVQKLLRERGVPTVVTAYEQHRQRMGSQLLQDMAPDAAQDAENGDVDDSESSGLRPFADSGDEAETADDEPEDTEEAQAAEPPEAPVVSDLFQPTDATSARRPAVEPASPASQRTATRPVSGTIMPPAAPSDAPLPYRAPVLDPLAQLRRQSRDLHQLREFLLMVQQNRTP